MITAIHGPLIVEPEAWTLVFNREASTWWASWLAMGRYKHVRAYAYVPFLHVWVFYDVNLSGTSPLVIAADGEPAKAMIASWTVNADLMAMRRLKSSRRNYHAPFLGFCVPAIKHLLGIRAGALRPDALWRHCLDHGGVPFESSDDRRPRPAEVRATAA